MPSALPDGEPVPSDGALPESALVGLGSRPFSVYVHVPFCSVRCGYCDFNTYTADELGGGASRATWAGSAVAELGLARRVLGDIHRPVSTVFFGGGTPTLLPTSDLVRVLRAIDDAFGLAADVEVTTEANPDSVTPASLSELREGGVTRVSFGMQSAVPHVLATLDRTHDPDNVPRAVDAARTAGFEQVSLDLIYGTPGESERDWQLSLDAATALAPDHVSAYSLIVEEGTRLAARIRRGDLNAPDDDVLADRYLQADESLSARGLQWYEVSNWATTSRAQCRHNLAYWRGHDWWGVGPGAHSHLGGTRWWNVKHPSAWTERLSSGESPAYAREVLDDAARRAEQILLEVRLEDGLDVELLDAPGRRQSLRLASEGLLDATALERGRVVLTRNGRLLADHVVRELVP